MTADAIPPMHEGETLRSAPPGRLQHSWTFLTNYGHVLLAVATEPGIRVVEIADRVGITPRAALQILKDLEDDGYLHRTRVGRRTHYAIEPHQHFRHPAASAQEIDGLIRLFTQSTPKGTERANDAS
jgi:hypothetical protein